MWETTKEQYRLGSSKISQVGQMCKVLKFADTSESEEWQCACTALCLVVLFVRLAGRRERDGEQGFG